MVFSLLLPVVELVPGNFIGITLSVLGIVAPIVVLSRLSRGPNLNAFPTVGPTNLLASWWGLQFMTKATDIIQEGYEKYKSVPFKIADGYKWIVILTNREHLEELSRASEDQFSFFEAFDEKFNLQYTLGHNMNIDPYHIGVIRFRMTRNIEILYPDIREEIVTGFDEVLDIGGDEWKSVPAFDAIQRVISRAANRVLVGLPLCRNIDWINIGLQCNHSILKDGLAMGLFPGFLRPLAACFFSDVAGCVKRSMKYLGPIIEERQKYMNEYGNKWIDKPNDLLAWLMDEAKGSWSKPELLVPRALFVNFTAIHTSSISFTHALLYLAANPQYIRPLREEVELIVEKEGWSKASIGKMHKVDSFLRECQRMEGISTVNLSRKALKDYTFSDGTFIPKGTTVNAPARSLHYDDQFYENADAFEPFRFSKLYGEGSKSVKHQFTSTATEYLPFGHGKHACPGRFFVATELKTMLAYVAVAYDIKLEDNISRPPSLHFATAVRPDPSAKVLFRKRID